MKESLQVEAGLSCLDRWNECSFIHSFITWISIGLAPLQGYYSEALPTLARLKRAA